MCAVDLIVTKFQVDGAENLEGWFRRLGTGADDVEGRLRKMGALGGGMVAIGAGGAVGMAAFAKAALDAGGLLQRVQGGFETMLGSPEAAKAKIKEIQAFALETPFDFAQSAQSAQQMLAMGIAGKDLLPIMRAVGDATSAAGGDTETFQRALYAIGEMRSIGTVQARQIRMLAMAGIPAFDILQKKLHLTNEEMENIGNKHLRTEDVLPMLVEGFNERFGGATAKQLETWPGQLSQLRDQWIQFLQATSGAIMPDAVNATAHLTALISKMTEFEKAHPAFAKAALGAGALAAGALVAGGAYLKITSALGLARLAKQGLTTATIADTAAERMKAGVAIAEGRGIEFSAAASYRAAEAKAAAAIAAEEEAAALGAGGVAAETAGASFLSMSAAGLAALAVTAFGISETIAGVRNATTLSDEDLRKKGPMGELQASAGGFLASQALYHENRAGNRAEAEAMRLNSLSQQRSINRHFMDEQRAQATPGYGEGGAGLGYYAGGNPAAPAVLARQQRAANARNKTTVTVSVDNPYTPADEDFDDRNSHSLYG